MIMGKQKITGLSASLLEPASVQVPVDVQAAHMVKSPKPVVQTVKVPSDVYIRLKAVGAHERRSSQDIILTAVREYLERFPKAS